MTRLASLFTALGIGIALVLGLPAFGQERGAARLGNGDEASEYWDLTAVFGSGHRLFARFSISNEGPGSRTAYAMGQLVFPDGRILPFKNGRLDGGWKLSEDGRRLKIGSSVLDLREALHHFEVDKNTQGVKLFFDFEPRHDPVRWADPPPGLNVDLLALGAAIDGTIWTREHMGGQEPAQVSGRASLTHVWMDESETGLALRRIEPHLLGGSRTGTLAYLLEVLPSRSSPRHWLVVRRPDGSWRQTSQLEIVESGRLAGTPDEYPAPARLDLRGPGVSGRIEHDALILKHDPLSLAPLPFRWLLSMRADPMHLWLRARGQLRWEAEGEVLEFEGDGVTSLYFIVPASAR